MQEIAIAVNNITKAYKLYDKPTDRLRESLGLSKQKRYKEILALIEDCNQKYGTTIIMVTHNEAIKYMADHVVKLRDGVVRHNDINEKKIPASELEW